MATCGTLTSQIADLQRRIDDDNSQLSDPELCDRLTKQACMQLREQITRDRNTAIAERDVLEQQLSPICKLLVGTWAFDGNGYTGTLTIEDSDVQDNGSASLTGHAAIDVPHTDAITGSYDNSTGVLLFTRTGDDGNARFQPQQYYGHFFANPRGNEKPTFAGVFAEATAPLGSPSPWGWSMVKQ